MNIVETEKIKGLINSSPILTATERTEWLGLLDVMDDRQRGELERILLGGTPPKQGGEASNFAKASSDKLQLSSAGSQIPRLSHIMNLPNLGSVERISNAGTTLTSTFAKASADKPALSQRERGEIAGIKQSPVQNNTSGFASKLKAMFKEKELPAGNEELELPDGGANRNKEIENRNREIDEIRGQKVQTPAPKPFFPVKEKPLADFKPVKSIPPVKSTLSAPKISPPPVPKPKAVVPVAMPVKPTPIAAVPVAKAPARVAQSINSPGDLALLGNQALRDTPLDTLVKIIKILTAKYGYFEVIFNLEKSPVFKNYIDSGLKLLAGQSGSDGDNLTKEEVEEFADLLAKIQTG